MLRRRRKALAILAFALAALLVVYYLREKFGDNLRLDRAQFDFQRNAVRRRALVAEFRSLANTVNKTLEDYGRDFMAQQEVLKKAFCTQGKSGNLWCATCLSLHLSRGAWSRRCNLPVNACESERL